MAELSYNDVMRAAKDGVSSVRSELQKIAMQTQQIASLQRSVQAVQTEIFKIEQVQSQSANIDQKVLGLINDVQGLKVRLYNLEKLSVLLSDFLRRQEEEADNSGFRTA